MRSLLKSMMKGRSVVKRKYLAVLCIAVQGIVNGVLLVRENCLVVELPEGKRQALEAVIDALKNVGNLLALVLGGSYARGVAQKSSDIDIGVYYREAAPLAVDDVRRVAARICTPGSTPVVTELYGWGPWVNGGAWIQTPATKESLEGLRQLWMEAVQLTDGLYEPRFDLTAAARRVSCCG